MTPHIDTLRDDLAGLHRKGHIDGPTRLFLGHVLDYIQAMEQRGMTIGPSAIRPGFFDSAKAMPVQTVGCSVCYGLNPHGCPACSKIRTNEGMMA